MNKKELILNIRNPDCNLCPLHEYCTTKCILGRGDYNSEVVIIAEAPGQQEDIEGKPFIGKSGNLLERLLVETGFKSIPFLNSKDKFNVNKGPYITNAVKCRPLNDNNPKVEELTICQEYLIKELKIIKPKLIIALGNYSQYLFTGLTTGIESIRGSFKETEYGTVFFSLHPANILHDQSGGRVDILRKDLKRAREYLNNPKLKNDKSVKFKTHETIDSVKELAKELSNVKKFAIDLETNGLYPQIIDNPEIICITIATNSEEGHIIWLPSFDNPNDIWDILKPIIENPKIFKILANAKFDSLWIKYVTKLNPRGFIYDIILMHHLLYPHIKFHNLKFMSGQFLGDGHYDEEIRKILLKNKQEYVTALSLLRRVNKYKRQETKEKYLTKNKYNSIEDLEQEVERLEVIVSSGFAGIPVDVIAEYAVKDAIYTYRIYLQLSKEIQDNKMSSIYLLEAKMCEALVDVEHGGIGYDINESEKVRDYYNTRRKEIEEELNNSPNIKKTIALLNEKQEKKVTEFNPNSSKHKYCLFKEVLKWDTPVKTKKTGSPSYGDKALKKCDHKEAQLILDLIHVKRMITTYIDGMQKLVSNKVLYPSFNNTGTISGRLSSGFHTLPKKVKEDRILRKPFQSKFVDGLLMEADESQLELRVAAHIYQDEHMLSLYLEGIDVHKNTAAKMFGVDLDDVAYEQRQMGKATNFSLIYDSSAKGLMEKFNDDYGVVITIEEAEKFIEDFFLLYPGIKRGIDKIKRRFGEKTSKSKHYTSSIFGRYMDLHYSWSLEKDKKKKLNNSYYSKKKKIKRSSYAERLALNFPIQSVGSDITQLAIMETLNQFKKYNMLSRGAGTIHDSGIFDIIKHELENAIEIATIAFTHPPIKKYFPKVNFTCPLEVGIEIGSNLFTMEEI